MAGKEVGTEGGDATDGDNRSVQDVQEDASGGEDRREEWGEQSRVRAARCGWRRLMDKMEEVDG